MVAATITNSCGSIAHCNFYTTAMETFIYSDSKNYNYKNNNNAHISDNIYTTAMATLTQPHVVAFKSSGRRFCM